MPQTVSVAQAAVAACKLMGLSLPAQQGPARCMSALALQPTHPTPLLPLISKHSLDQLRKVHSLR